MQEERRENTIGEVLVKLGVLIEKTDRMKDDIEGLNKKVAIQNGRVTKSEAFILFAKGAISVLTVVIIPVILYVINEVIHRAKF